jgi:hypothetical protein
MTRRVVVAVTLLGVLGGGAGAAFADNGPSRKPDHELCLLLSGDPDHSTTQDYCITWPGPVGTQ